MSVRRGRRRPGPSGARKGQTPQEQSGRYSAEDEPLVDLLRRQQREQVAPGHRERHADPGDDGPTPDPIDARVEAQRQRDEQAQRTVTTVRVPTASRP